MQQIINLYQVQFRKSKASLSAKDSIVLFGAVLSIMLYMTVESYMKVSSNNALLANTTEELETIDKEVATIKARMDAQSVDPRLVKSIQQMGKHFNMKQEILGLIEKPLNNTQSKFSVLLEGLARQHVQGMWLTLIDVNNGGTQLSLHGSTLQPVSIPEFVGKLNRETAYVGREFKTLSMERTLDNKDRIDFILTTDQKEQSGLAGRR